MSDAKLVSAAIASRQAYEKLAPHITDKDLSPPGQYWWKLVGEWYARDSSTVRVDVSTLTDLGKSGTSNPKTRDLVSAYLRDLPDPISPANAAIAALELKRHNAGLELAAAIASGDGKKQAKALALFNELTAATELKSRREAKYERASNVTDLFSKVGQSNRLPLYPSSLNSRIDGGALPGHHIILFGRPEVGKSTFSVNFAVGMAIKQSQKVLYVGNEDQINILKARAVSRVTNLTAAEIEADRATAIALYTERGGEERLQFVQMFDGSTADLRPLIEEFEPTVIVLDQIRNLASEADSDVNKLEGNGQDFRRLLLEYKMIGLSVTQAGVTAEGKAWLGMEDMYGSKTGLPGTGDLIIGMGADSTMMARGQRALNPIKNKLSSASNSREGILVEIDASRSGLK